MLRVLNKKNILQSLCTKSLIKDDHPVNIMALQDNPFLRSGDDISRDIPVHRVSVCKRNVVMTLVTTELIYMSINNYQTEEENRGNQTYKFTRSS